MQTFASSVPGGALLLGFSSGLVCMVSCGSLLVPWLGGRAQGPGATARLLGLFLAGRLVGYLLFALIAFGMGWILARGPGGGHDLLALAQIALALLLLADGLSWVGRAPCALSWFWRLRPGPGAATPLLLGFFTGLNLCPPFLMALCQASRGHSLGHALLTFLFFFLGTSPWVAPFLLLGACRRWEAFRHVARLTMLIMAAYYLATGSLLLLEGHLHG
jgi:sulfite exporter TauE/SafE